MMHVECPWCAGSATVENAGGGESIAPIARSVVELAPEPIDRCDVALAA